MKSPCAVLLAFLWGLGFVQSTIVTHPLIPHHVQRERRRKLSGGSDEMDDSAPMQRRRANDASSVGALYQGYGTHYADIWVGTPPQRQTVIVDTGSSITAFPCEECNDCGYPGYHTDNYFMESDSSTFHLQTCDKCSQRGNCESNNRCTIGMSYQEGSSWSAYESVDMAYVGGPHTAAILDDHDGEDIDPQTAAHLAFPMTFGCQTSLKGLFKTQMADGIMGMDMEKTSFWNQLHSAGKIENEIFAMCYSRQPTPVREGTEAGALTLGGIDERLHTSPVTWAASQNKGGFFKVQVQAVYLRQGGGEGAVSNDSSAEVEKLEISARDLNKGGVIVDSGTTDTYWNMALGTPFRQAWIEMVGSLFHNNPQRLTEEKLAELPTILVQLKGDAAMNASMDSRVAAVAGALDPQNPKDIIIAFPPSHYMEYSPSKKTYTNRFYVSEGGNTVLGGNFMMGHNVIFDVENDRIGWAESDCDYTKLVTDGGYPSVLDESTVVSPVSPGEPVRPDNPPGIDTPIPVEPDGGNGSTEPGQNPLEDNTFDQDVPIDASSADPDPSTLDSNGVTPQQDGTESELNPFPNDIDNTNNINDNIAGKGDDDNGDLPSDDFVEAQSHGNFDTDDESTEDDDSIEDSGVAPVTEKEKEMETYEESKLDQESEIAQEEEQDGFDPKKDSPTGTGANIHDFQIPTEDIKKSLHHAASECSDIYCIGSMVAIVLATLCCGCIMGQLFCCCCCRRRSAPKYRPVEVEMNGKRFKDEPDDIDYDPEYGDEI